MLEKIPQQWSTLLYIYAQLSVTSYQVHTIPSDSPHPQPAYLTHMITSTASPCEQAPGDALTIHPIHTPATRNPPMSRHPLHSTGLSPLPPLHPWV